MITRKLMELSGQGSDECQGAGLILVIQEILLKSVIFTCNDPVVINLTSRCLKLNLCASPASHNLGVRLSLTGKTYQNGIDKSSSRQITRVRVELLPGRKCRRRRGRGDGG
jgi:hypothetical protein